MKKTIFYFVWALLCAFFAGNVQAQSPGGVAGAKMTHTYTHGQITAEQKKMATQAVENADVSAPQIQFTPNRGQYKDKNVLYTAAAPFGHYTITPQGLVLGVYDTASLREINEYQNKIEDRQTGRAFRKAHPQSPALRGTGILLKLVGANPAGIANSKTAGESSDHTNWLYPGKAITNVHSYSTVTVNDIYPGIAIKY